MHSDTYTLIGGSILSVIIGQITATEQTDLFNLLSNISATGVLCVTLWWLFKRIETQLDDMRKDYKELALKLIEMLQDKEDDNG